jgi:hypothetical protein
MKPVCYRARRFLIPQPGGRGICVKNHIKKWTLLAPLAALLAAPSHAAYGAKSITAEIGANYAVDGDVRDATQSTGFHVGLGYALPTKPSASGNPSWSTIGLMYNQNSGNGNKLTVWGLTAEQRWAMGAKNENRKTTPYVGAGIGVYRVRGEADNTVVAEDISATAGSGAGTTEGESNSETKTRIGGRVMAGLTFSESYYAELAYNLTGKVLGSRSDSITLSIGARL